MKERQFIEWIRSRTTLDDKVVPVGPGDDCAVVMIGGRQVLVTTDQLLDGVHFVLAEHGPGAAGRKAVARSLSDIAAMAAAPVAAVATVALPRDAQARAAEAIYEGMREIADEFGCPIVGGDVGIWSGPLAISVTIFGRSAGDQKPIRPVLRSGAKPGDSVCVTGRLGGAWRSRRHLEFTPRVAEAIELASLCEIHAMIDVSDGLSVDLQHICKASGVAAEIMAKDIPIHEDARQAATDEQPALKAALSDGEDYELLFTLPMADADNLVEAQPLDVKVSQIGSIVKGEGITLIALDGRRKPLEPRGWEHETDS